MSLNADFNRKLNMFYGFVQDEADKDSKTEDSMSDKEYKTYRAKKENSPLPRMDGTIP